MNDVTGKLLEIGDKIVLIPQQGYTDSLEMGVIIGFTPQKVKIQLCFKDWSLTHSKDTCLKFPEQVAKV